jgi:hypothetical protein
MLSLKIGAKDSKALLRNQFMVVAAVGVDN